jgi:transposase-like protein
VKKRYQINKERALQQFKAAAQKSQQEIQLVLPLPEVMTMVSRGLMNIALAMLIKLAEGMMNWEVEELVGPKNRAPAERQLQRWGKQQGYCVVNGQKVPLQRPRLRDKRQREVPLGSYEAIQQASLLDEAIWRKIMHGLSMRSYGEVVRELQESYGIEKSSVSAHFIEGSRQRLQTIETRSLKEQAFCALFIDGTYFQKQQLICALGLTLQGQKMVLGLRQGATENATVVRQLLEDLQERGLDFSVPRLYVLDGGKALAAALRKVAGPCAQIQRCQIHKIRNVVDHLTEEHQMATRCKMRNAYAMRDYADAKRALDALLHHLMLLNPSAARSLEEGMEETLTVHRLRVPHQLKEKLDTTNIIESAFSSVETICRNVKRWQDGDQRLRWVASSLLWAEARWNRVHHREQIPILVRELELAVVKKIPLRRSSVAS